MSWVITLTICTALIVGFFSGAAERTRTAEKTNVPSVLVVDPSALEFGTRFEGVPFVWSVPVRNTSDSEVVVTKVLSSCNCGGVEPNTLTLGPGETHTLRLNLNLRRRESVTADVMPYEIALAAYVAGAEATPHTWKVRGYCRSVLDVRPPVCDFGEGLRAGVVVSPITLVAVPRMPFREVRAHGPPDWAVRVEHDGQRYHIEVQPPAQMAPGEFESSVRLTPVGLDESELGAIEVPCRGRVTGVVEAVPNGVRLGARPVGSDLDGTFSLQSERGEAFTVLRAVPGPGITISSLGGGSVAYRCTIEARGDGQSFIDVVVRLPNMSEHLVRFPVSFYGH